MAWNMNGQKGSERSEWRLQSTFLHLVDLYHGFVCRCLYLDGVVWKKLLSGFQLVNMASV